MTRRLDREEREELLAGVHVGVISIASPEPDRSPVAVPIWYSYEPAEGVSVVTHPASRKAQAIEQAGRFAMVAQREAMPYWYVSVEGPVVASRPASQADVELLARRYLGELMGTTYAMQPATYEGMVRYTMQPQRWATYSEADGP